MANTSIVIPVEIFDDPINCERKGDFCSGCAYLEDFQFYCNLFHTKLDYNQDSPRRKCASCRRWYKAANGGY